MIISELEAWFAKTELPEGAIQLSLETIITHVKAFLKIIMFLVITIKAHKHLLYLPKFVKT